MARGHVRRKAWVQALSPGMSAVRPPAGHFASLGLNLSPVNGLSHRGAERITEDDPKEVLYKL